LTAPALAGSFLAPQHQFQIMTKRGNARFRQSSQSDHHEDSRAR
jgi:hypothetical protein